MGEGARNLFAWLRLPTWNQIWGRGSKPGIPAVLEGLLRAMHTLANVLLHVPEECIHLPTPGYKSAFSDKGQFTRIGHIPGGGQPLLREGGPISYEATPFPSFQHTPANVPLHVPEE